MYEKHGCIQTPYGTEVAVDVWVGRRTAGVTLNGPLGIQACLNESKLDFNVNNRNPDGTYRLNDSVTSQATRRFISAMRDCYVYDIDVEHFRLAAQPAAGTDSSMTIHISSRRAVSPTGTNVEEVCRQWGELAWQQAHQIYGTTAHDTPDCD